jgi:MFS family permease
VAVLIPIIGLMLDKYGHRLNCLFMACVLSIIAHSLLLSIQNVIPLILLGICYALFGAAIWPTIPYVVP